jgi:cytosine/adenosine deaminase-related metal-dependent hydrolase
VIVTADWVLPVTEPPIRHGAVAVREGVVVEVGMAADVCARWLDDADAVELDGCILAPGLVNAHTHLSLTALRGLTRRVPLPEWLPSVTKVVLGLSHEEFGASATLGALACLVSGTTVVGDVVYGGEAVRAATDIGLGGAFCWEVLGMDPAEMRESLERRGWPLPGEEHIYGDEDRVEAGVSPHSPYASGPHLLQAAHTFARRHGGPFVIHVAESEFELAVVADGSGPFADQAGRLAHGLVPAGLTPVAYLDSLGVLDDAVCVHAVHLTDADIALLAEKARGVVLCPRSNEWLRNGPPPVAALRAAGVRLAVGTDSLGSNADLDLFAEVAALRALDPTLGDAEALWMMTAGGAQLLGMAGSFGAIAPGVQADLVAVRADAGDADDPVAALLARGTDGVESVMVRGEWRVRDCGPTFDTAGIEAAGARVAAHAAELVGDR